MVGIVLGTLLRPLPLNAKRVIVASCGVMRDSLPRPLWSMIRPAVYECTRALFLGTQQSCVMERIITPGVHMRLDVAQKAQRRIYTERVYEATLVSYFASVVRPGDGFVDVGANAGYYTLLASKWVGGKGLVQSFEPECENFARLSWHVAANHLTNVTMHQIAAGAIAGALTLNLNPLNEGGHSLIPHEIYFDDGRSFSEADLGHWFPAALLSQEVSVALLDSLLPRDERRWHMKIDVEGAELDALLGARGFIKHARPDICCEVRVWTDELRDLIDSLQYEVCSIRTDGTLEIIDELSPGDFILRPR